MLPAALKIELVNSFSVAAAERHCVLCGTDLKAYLDEVPCPHWFITSGRRAFSERHLRSIFTAYDTALVIEYLTVVYSCDRVGRRDFTSSDLGCSIRLRERRWTFEKLTGRSSGYTVSVFNGERRTGCWQVTDDPI